MYDSTGNKVISKSVEIEETNLKNVYFRDGYLILKVEQNGISVYAEIDYIGDIYRIYRLSEQIKELLDCYIDSWKIRYPSLLLIEVNRALGNDVSPIILAREKYIKDYEEEQKRKDQERGEKRKAEQKIKLEEDLRDAKETVEKLKSGEKVTFSSLVHAIDVLKINVHPRTKGAILKQNGYYMIGKKGGEFNKGTKNATAQSMFQLIEMIAS